MSVFYEIEFAKYILPYQARVKQWIRKVPGTVALVHLIESKR